jgi:dihydrofolate synthase/folylpolyglutamate synthase
MGNTVTKEARSRKATATGSVTKRARRAAPVTAIRNYRAAINFLKSKTNYETMVRVGYNSANFNLSRMLRILSRLGNPHKACKMVHIAGTKGKGSTAHMVAAMLKRSGYRTGLYTSPHFLNLRERISIDGQLITEPAFARLMARIAPVARKLAKDKPTFFDLMTVAAFLHFANNKVDIAVIETGLGGRLDSTNVIRPEACGITSISYDHMAQLGTTLEAIAEEKAGIFKPGVPAISAPQPAGVKRVLRDQARKTGCPLYFVGGELEFSYRFECSRIAGPHTRVCMATPTTRFDHIRVPLLGEHQAHNCGVALGIIDALQQRGMNIGPQNAIDGLAEVKVQGRLETIRQVPHTIVDAAHNAASIRALMRAIGQNVGYDSMVVIFGCSADKDVDGMLDQLQIGADKVIFTGTGTPRSMDPHELFTRFQENSPKMAMVEDTLLGAYRTACNCVTREDLICITGSVYLVGHAKRQLGTDVLT